MVILDITVRFLGRFQVLDDMSVLEVLLLPWTTEEEMALLQQRLQSTHSPFTLASDCLLAALCTHYGAIAEDITFHERNDELLFAVEEDPGL